MADAIPSLSFQQPAPSVASLPSNDFQDVRNWQIVSRVVAYTAIGILGALAAVFLLVFPPVGVAGLIAGLGVFYGAVGILSLGTPIFAGGGESFPMGQRPDSERSSSQDSSSSSPSSGSNSSSSSNSISNSSSSPVLERESFRCESTKPLSSPDWPSSPSSAFEQLAGKGEILYRSKTPPPSQVEYSMEELHRILDAEGYDVKFIQTPSLITLQNYARIHGQEKMLQKLKREGFLKDCLKSKSSPSFSSVIAPSSIVSEPSVHLSNSAALEISSLEELERALPNYRVSEMDSLSQQQLREILFSKGEKAVQEYVEKTPENRPIFDPYFDRKASKEEADEEPVTLDPIPGASPPSSVKRGRAGGIQIRETVESSTVSDPAFSGQVDPVPSSSARGLEGGAGKVHFFPLTPPSEKYEPLEEVEEITV